MPYNLDQTKTAFTGGKNILASEHFQYIEVGATLKGGSAYALGEAIGKVASGADQGLWVKYVNGATYADLGILNVDVDNVASNTVVGEVLTRGSVYAAKLPASVTAEFKTKTPMIRYISR
ncbi:hypothetical protein ACQKM1_22340 [Peribacillus frigoritolerans]|uniref:hypothetical protein n=1 Tax=Peribacillus frigoritolerans TaxID=450367 RepID=UPI003CFE6BF8